MMPGVLSSLLLFFCCFILLYVAHCNMEGGHAELAGPLEIRIEDDDNTRCDLLLLVFYLQPVEPPFSYPLPVCHVPCAICDCQLIGGAKEEEEEMEDGGNDLN